MDVWKRKSFTYRAWNTRGNFGFNNLSSSGFRPETRYGMDAAVGLPHSYELRSTHKVKVEDVFISESSNSDETSYSIQSYTYSIGYDTRDVIFNPLNGAYYIVSIENGFKLNKTHLFLQNMMPRFQIFTKHLKIKPLPLEFPSVELMEPSKKRNTITLVVQTQCEAMSSTPTHLGLVNRNY